MVWGDLMKVYDWQKAKTLSLLVVLSLVIGVFVGSLETLFGKVLLEITAFRAAHFLPLVLFLVPVGILFVYFFHRFGQTSVAGMGLVFRVAQEGQGEIPKRLVPFMIVGTWLTHLVGGSAGREGVAVQIGATVGHWMGKAFQGINQRWFIIIGMAAGFAGLFQTPIAATFFALEVLFIGKIYSEIFLPTLVAAYSASYTSHFLKLEKFTFLLAEEPPFSWSLFLQLILLAVCFTLASNLFSQGLRKMKMVMASRFVNPVWRVGLMGLVLTLLLIVLHFGRYAGLGSNLVVASFTGGAIYSYDWLLKIVLTLLTLSIGFQGGEVTPLFAIGATLGAYLATLFGLPVPFTAALGYMSVFGGATNTLLAPIFIGGEVFGWQNFPYYLLVCGVVYSLNRNWSVYNQLKIPDA